VLIYTGRDARIESSLVTAIVMKLMGPLLKLGQTVWMDNYCNSPDLVRSLKTAYQADFMGTLKLDEK
jgi:phage gp46-like protein